jgi:dienelactone hydrolase
MPMPQFPALTEWFVARGYAVLVPQRPGHGETGGRYLEDQGRCSNANFEKSGRATADSIAAAIDFMAGQGFIKPDGIVVVGNSAGGWGALALAGRNPPNVRAVINFSGGRGGRNLGKAGRNCSPGKLVAAAGAFGRAARIPSLWLYAENDSYFAPDLSTRIVDAYRAAGGTVEFHLLPAVAAEGHNLIQTSGPAASWAPYVETFLSR